ncbi:hypothetical protein TNCV_1535681 [Trichonephila clavipes]|uniref:Uncharacterized protein n=1 Tax=Trichonephila clavipes TaxID=2585209 RepID=A0A8X6R7P9_TRICX|nr:hypothetical protein TNCV_1535681 [Trichonephila clavipes]
MDRRVDESPCKITSHARSNWQARLKQSREDLKRPSVEPKEICFTGDISSRTNKLLKKHEDNCKKSIGYYPIKM